MSAERQRLEEGLLEYLFGDDEMDPAWLVTEGAKESGFREHLDELEGELDIMTEAAGFGAEVREGSRERLRIVRDEIDRRSSAVAATPQAQVVSLADRRAAREAKQKRWMRWGAATLALAAALALVFVWGPGRESREASPPGPSTPTALATVTADQVDAWSEVVGAGTAFSGETPSPFARGFLFGLAADAAGSGLGDLARDLRHSAATGLSGDAAAIVSKGCRGMLGGDRERAECAHGLFAYRMRRDLELANTADADSRARSTEAGPFVDWLAARVAQVLPSDPAATAAAQLKPLVGGGGAVSADERGHWMALLRDVGAFTRIRK